jgi:hypothetical protein
MEKSRGILTKKHIEITISALQIPSMTRKIFQLYGKNFKATAHIPQQLLQR